VTAWSFELGSLLSEANNGLTATHSPRGRRKLTARLQPEDAKGVPAKECDLVIARSSRRGNPARHFAGDSIGQFHRHRSQFVNPGETDMSFDDDKFREFKHHVFKIGN
jgi:hypothetical protein